MNDLQTWSPDVQVMVVYSFTTTRRSDAPFLYEHRLYELWPRTNVESSSTIAKSFLISEVSTFSLARKTRAGKKKTFGKDLG
jgi:hypothetical protein